MSNLGKTAAGARCTKITDANGVHIITRDEATGLIWTARDVGHFTNSAKNSEAEKFAREFSLGDVSDWRVPTIDELETIRDRTRYNPAIDTEFFPDCPSAGFWSCTPDAESPSDCAWVQYSCFGGSSIYGRGYRRRLRLVSGPSRQFSASLLGAEG